MNQNLITAQSVIVNATVDAAWKVLTEPELIKEYLFGTQTITDWKVGSPIVFQGEYQGQTYRDHGVILEYIPNQRLSYSYWSGFSGLEDKPENYSKVTLSLVQKEDGKVEFTWSQQGFATEEGQKHSLDGMPAFLLQIKEIMERQ